MSEASSLCRACGATSVPLWQGRLLDLQVQYHECPTCDYIQTEHPHWLDRAYAETINASDTGILSRNLINTRITLATLAVLGHLKGTVVDSAGGFGLLVRLLRDYGINALWSDPYCQNLVSVGFEYADQSAELVTSFEAFEHYVEPEKEIGRLLEIAPNVLFSTLLAAKPAPAHEHWWYYGKEHGQHVGFFRAKTLAQLANRKGRHFLSDGVAYHLFSERPVNAAKWRLALKINRIMPFLLRPFLKSKNWADHLLMSRQPTDD